MKDLVDRRTWPFDGCWHFIHEPLGEATAVLRYRLNRQTLCYDAELQLPDGRTLTPATVKPRVLTGHQARTLLVDALHVLRQYVGDTGAAECKERDE